MTNYISISNKSGKNWVIPVKNASTALEIYQPTAWRGKLIKSMLPLALKTSIITNKLENVHMESVIPADIMSLITLMFYNDKLQVSYFGGTPGTHCKPTIQVFSGKKLLGYVKYTKNLDIVKLFNNEEIILKRLHDCGIRNVPHCITNQKLSSSTYVFVQDTKKKISSKILHQYEEIHDHFLDNLYSLTKVKISFQITDYAQTLIDLKKKSAALSLSDQHLIQKASEKVWNYFENQKELEFGVCHRDFTPWNNCIINGELYVFDWEYAKMTYPNGMDAPRFFVEVYRQEKKYDNIKILKKYKKNKKSMLMLCCYLLDNIYIYLDRGQKSDHEIIASSMELLRLSMDDI